MSSAQVSAAGPIESSRAMPRGLSVALIVCCVVGVAWFSAPTLVSLHEVWIRNEYSHGYLVVLMSAFLLARALRGIGRFELVGSPLGVALVGLCLVGMVAGLASTTLIIAQMLVPALWLAVMWAIGGWAIARRLVLPVGYLYFAIPFWDLFIESLQGLTVTVVSAMVWVFGLPAFVEGNLIHIPSGSFEVEGGCSGLHFFIVGLALAAFSGLWQHERTAVRLVLLGTALVLSLVANWVRVFLLIVIGHVSEMQHYLVAVDHYYFGWAVFVVCLAPLFVLSARLRSDTDAPRPAVSGVRMSTRAAYLTALSCLVLGSGVWVNQRVVADVSDDVPQAAIQLPVLPGWRRAADWRDASAPTFVGAKAEAGAWYARDSELVGAYVAHYPVQRQQEEVVFYANQPQGDAAVVARSRYSLRVSEGLEIPFAEFEVLDSPRAPRRLVWFGKIVAGVPADGEISAKGLQVLGALKGRWDAQALVLTTVCAVDCDEARSRLAAFAALGAEALVARRGAVEP